jgi:hypothetical protein
MTGRSGGGLSAIPKLWILPVGVLSGILFAAFAGVISTSVVLDLIAWWPVWAALGLLLWLTRGRRLGAVRLSGLVPLVASGAMIAFLVGHLQGWAAMPSAAGTLVGPETAGVESVSLSASIDGSLLVTPGAAYLYMVAPIRWGGEVGLAQGFEEVSGAAMRVSLRPDPQPGLLTFRGWDVSLAEGPAWDLDLSGSVDADLTRLVVSGLDLGGSGRAILGRADGPTAVSVTGTFTLVIPEGQAARVVGEATVPQDWIAEEGSWRAPIEGDGWVIEVASGGQVVVEGP